jgi:cyanuric acid amidohydrolase
MAKVQKADVFKIPMASPTDVSGIVSLIDSGQLEPKNIVAIIAKTEGNGLVNDFSRGLTELALKVMLSEKMGVTREKVADQISMVMSGGCPGLMSPHFNVFAREWIDGNETPDKRFVVGVAYTEELLPEDIGRMKQIEAVGKAVEKAMVESGITDPNDVHFVQVKNGLLTKPLIADAKKRGKTVVTEETGITYNGSMCYANDASALGVGLGLKEIPHEKLNDGVVRKDFSLFSNVSSTSSGGEKNRAEVVVMGNSVRSVSKFRIGHSAMRDLIDANGVREALRSAGLRFDHEPSESDRKRIVNVFAKAVVPGHGSVRGRRFCMHDDSDIGTKPARAVGNAVIASVIGDTMNYVSGGEVDSHSGPPDGNPVAAIIRI